MNLSSFVRLKTINKSFLTLKSIDLSQIRTTSSFFTRLSASQLWKGVTSVSNVGRKRGRAKGLMKPVDLNKGQIIGVGSIKIDLPGLNTRVFEGKNLNKVVAKDKDEEFLKKLHEFRVSLTFRKKKKLHPLERGFSGNSLIGRSIGVPTELQNDLKDFDCKVIKSISRAVMQKNVGRVRKVTTIVACGNKKGLIGFGKAHSRDQRKSTSLARGKALKKLRFINLDNNTIIHDFTSSFGTTTIVCFKMPAGFGVVADNVIKSVCNLIGIEDLYVKVIRNQDNKLNILNAFIFGLTKQKSYQDIADEKKLNLVEFREENDYLPRLIAKPSDGVVRKREEIDSLEIMDFRQYLFEGRIYEPEDSSNDRSKDYLNYINYAKFLQTHHKHRSNLQVRANLRKRYGKVESFLTLREKEERKKKFGDVKTNDS